MNETIVNPLMLFVVSHLRLGTRRILLEFASVGYVYVFTIVVCITILVPTILSSPPRVRPPHRVQAAAAAAAIVVVAVAEG